MEFTVIPYMFLQGLATKLTGVLMCIVSVYFYLTGSMPLLYTIIMTISSFMIYESLDMMGGFSALMRNVNIIVDKTNKVLSIPPMDIDGEEITPKKTAQHKRATEHDFKFYTHYMTSKSCCDLYAS
jgi:ATP-binding cassette subfamily B protein